MNYFTALLALSSIGLVSIGQLLMKIAANSYGKLSITQLVLSAPLISAMAAYGASIVLWFFVLKTMPLKLAYPFAALAFVLVPLLAYWVLGESLSLKWLLGSSLIMLGIIIAAN
jgi:multidrug transporter EmrE-like cation transporter